MKEKVKIVSNNEHNLKIALNSCEGVKLLPILAWKIIYDNDSHLGYDYAIPIIHFEYSSKYAIYDISNDEWEVPCNILFAGDYSGKGKESLETAFIDHNNNYI